MSESPLADGPALEGLAQVFRCMICLMRLHEAHLCPHCAKVRPPLRYPAAWG